MMPQRQIWRYVVAAAVVAVAAVVALVGFIYWSDNEAHRRNTNGVQLREFEAVVGIDSEKPLTPLESAVMRNARARLVTDSDLSYEESLEELARQKGLYRVELSPVDLDERYRQTLRESVYFDLPPARSWLSSGPIPSMSFPDAHASHPAAVALYTADQSGPYCSGVVIGPRAVLTATHCVCGPPLVEARLGEVTAPRREALASLAIAQMFHKSTCNEWFKDGDLAVVRLRSNVPKTILPARLPTEQDYKAFDAQARKIIISGYGPFQARTGRRLGGAAVVASHSCSETVKVWPNSAPISAAEHYKCLPSREIVIDRSLHPQRRSTGTCTGDSGGPGFADGTGEDTISPILLSITSRSVPGQTGCSEASILVRLVSNDVAWIKSNASLQ